MTRRLSPDEAVAGHRWSLKALPHGIAVRVTADVTEEALAALGPHVLWDALAVVLRARLGGGAEKGWGWQCPIVLDRDGATLWAEATAFRLTY